MKKIEIETLVYAAFGVGYAFNYCGFAAEELKLVYSIGYLVLASAKSKSSN